MLIAQRLQKKIGGKQILHEMDFSVNAGQFVTVLGPNGAGKSSLFKILSQATQPSAGEILYEGQAINKISSEYRKKIGVISHHTFLYDNLSALENLRFYGQAYQVNNLEARIKEVLRSVGLQMHIYDAVRTFSRGMQQRLAIARSILHDPQLLFLDEPYTGLDQSAIQVLNDVLAALHTEQRTLFMITHNYEDALTLSNKLMVINKGKLVYNEDSTGLLSHEFRELYLRLVRSDSKRA